MSKLATNGLRFREMYHLLEMTLYKSSRSYNYKNVAGLLLNLYLMESNNVFNYDVATLIKIIM